MAQDGDAAARYDALDEGWYLEQQARRLRRIVEVLRDEHARGPVLELGALSGGFAAMYAPALGLRPDDVTCCDFSRAQLERAAGRGFKTVAWNLESEPPPPTLEEGHFQTLLFCEILEHLVDPGPRVEALVRLLAPRGLFVATTPNLASLPNRLRLLLGKTPSLGAAPGLSVRAPGSLAAFDHLRVCVPAEWKALLESAGLEVTRVEGCTSAPLDGETPRRRLSIALSRAFERLPGSLWMNTLLVGRRR
jgi:SAM-dependent methyltransferase